MSCENILICKCSVSLTDCGTVMLIDIVCSSQMNGEVNNHPPDAKKAKMKVKHVVLPIEETFNQLLPNDRLSTYIEQEVLLTKCLFNVTCIHQYLKVSKFFDKGRRWEPTNVTLITKQTNNQMKVSESPSWKIATYKHN